MKEFAPSPPFAFLAARNDQVELATTRTHRLKLSKFIRMPRSRQKGARLGPGGVPRKLVDASCTWGHPQWIALAEEAKKVIVTHTAELCKHPDFEKWRKDGNMQKKVRAHADDLVKFWKGELTAASKTGSAKKASGGAQQWSHAQALVLAEESCTLILKNAPVLSKLLIFANWLPGDNTQRKVREVAESLVGYHKEALGLEVSERYRSSVRKVQRYVQAKTAPKSPQNDADQAATPLLEGNKRTRAQDSGSAMPTKRLRASNRVAAAKDKSSKSEEVSRSATFRPYQRWLSRFLPSETDL